VLVDRVNEIGPMVVNNVMEIVADGQQTGAADLKAPPADEIPQNHQALRSYEDLTKLLWPKFEAIMGKHSIPGEYQAFACCGPLARMIVVGQGQLEPAIGKTLAVTAMVQGSKTVPFV
jgi:hypothetical protein